MSQKICKNAHFSIKPVFHFQSLENLNPMELIEKTENEQVIDNWGQYKNLT